MYYTLVYSLLKISTILHVVSYKAFIRRSLYSLVIEPVTYSI